MTIKPTPRTVEGLTLALDMIGRAYEALATVYELRHPGEYSALRRNLKDYVADQFRHVEDVLTEDASGAASFRDAVLCVREVFDRVDVEIEALSRSELSQRG